ESLLRVAGEPLDRQLACGVLGPSLVCRRRGSRHGDGELPAFQIEPYEPRIPRLAGREADRPVGLPAQDTVGEERVESATRAQGRREQPEEEAECPEDVG